MHLPMLDVHEVFSYIHEESKLRTPVEHVNLYWRWCQHAECGFARLGGPGIVPVGLYADETKYGGNFSDEKVLGFFVNLVLHRPRSIRYSRFCIFACRSSLVLGMQTLGPIIERIVWGFQWAFKGVRPSGEALCRDGTRFLCTELRGDMAWHAMVWQFKNRWQSIQVCPFCCAKSKGDTQLYTETGDSASWLPTVYTSLPTWVEEVLPQNDLCGFFLL